jgi:hypothetical protein
MAKFNVFQIGSQRDVKVGQVDAADAEEAQDLAYTEFGDTDDKDKSFGKYPRTVGTPNYTNGCL